MIFIQAHTHIYIHTYIHTGTCTYTQRIYIKHASRLRSYKIAAHMDAGTAASLQPWLDLGIAIRRHLCPHVFAYVFLLISTV